MLALLAAACKNDDGEEAVESGPAEAADSAGEPANEEADTVVEETPAEEASEDTDATADEALTESDTGVEADSIKIGMVGFDGSVSPASRKRASTVCFCSATCLRMAHS